MSIINYFIELFKTRHFSHFVVLVEVLPKSRAARSLLLSCVLARTLGGYHLVNVVLISVNVEAIKNLIQVIVFVSLKS